MDDETKLRQVEASLAALEKRIDDLCNQRRQSLEHARLLRKAKLVALEVRINLVEARLIALSK